MKQELINYLKTKNIKTVLSLWGETKSYFKNKAIEMGGSYTSWGTNITVAIENKNELIRFKVSLEELE